MPSLLLLTGPSAGRRFELHGEAVIGRAPSCDLPLDDPKVSRRHAVVLLREGVVHVRDLGSRNGTVVKGHRIDGEVALSTGDQFQIGATTVLFDPPARVSMRARGTEPVADVALVGTASAFRQALEQTRRLGVAQGPMVFVGPAGAGKRALARHVHLLSARAAAPFVSVECRAPAEGVREALFGARGGGVRGAEGGTLLLAHVEALPPQLAGELAGWVVRGRAPGPEDAEEPVDVRLLATSARPVAALRGEGMPSELTGLLAAAEVQVPALAERSPDVPALFEHFAREAARRRFLAPPTLSPEARRRMTEYPWPGNLEELRLVAERLALLYPDQEIPSVRLPPEIQQGSVAAPTRLDTMLAKLEREAVAEALRAAGGKKVRAAELLGISRPTLDKKIADYGLTVDRERGPARRTP